MSLRVEVLCTGWIIKEHGMVVEAHSTSSVVLGGKDVIVVDTSDGVMRREIEHNLERLGLVPEDISVVVSTHLHHDHVSNDDLFPRARKIAHEGEGPASGREMMKEDELQLGAGIRIVHTPGHTRGAVSVFVEADKRIVIAGDALPTKDNYVKMVPPGLNYDPELAMESIRKIVGWADVVVPGHGPPFMVRH
ncbi:MAG: MBL fold metallo-hydrolase [Methanomassiliicoccales archaeon]|nr:MAG: MBL fold metallo-hydrolase [Methanomassiliicoccales archaeon]